VDAIDAALIGGALTGAGLAAVQWWAAGVDDQFTVFGAGGALLFMLLSGLLLARFTPARAQAG
jgi:hypothetical protein